MIRIALRLERPQDKKQDKPPVRLSIKEAAARIKKDPSTLWRWRKKPDCKLRPVIKHDGEVFYLEHEVDHYLQNSQS